MDEASCWLENITDNQQVIPTSDSNLSLHPPLVDQVINSVSSVIDPTLPSESELVKSMSFLPGLILLSKNIPIEAVTVIQSLPPPTLPYESGVQTAKVLMLHSDFSQQEEICLF